MKKYIIAVFCCILWSLPGGAQQLPAHIVRVGLITGAPTVTVRCEGNASFREMSTGEDAAVDPSSDQIVGGEDDRVVCNGRSFSSPVRLTAHSRDTFISINGRRYRDAVTIASSQGKLTVINELGLEEYLYGILPREADPHWPMETLKAQAVISRTYVLKNLGRHEKNSFDVCTQTHCQVYGGLESENMISNQAVDATKGEVVVWQGNLAQTLFHASCGGHTENPNCVWRWDCATPAYLKGCTDKFCKDSPHNNWKNKISADTIRARLQKAGYSVGTIKKIKLSGSTRSGRTVSLKITHSGGTLMIPAPKFRMAVDTWLIKSTLFTSIKKRGGAFEFSGRGWGHGVGLCQWGAKTLGEKGRDYREILKFYYPGADVETWNE